MRKNPKMAAERRFDDNSFRSCKLRKEKLKYFPAVTVDVLGMWELVNGVSHVDEAKSGCRAA